LINAQ
jgi:hypothetical protein